MAAVMAALEQAQLDPYLTGKNRNGEVITELVALLETVTFERLCRMASGTQPTRRAPAKDVTTGKGANHAVYEGDEDQDA